jgi:hypothetical protein
MSEHTETVAAGCLYLAAALIIIFLVVVYL